MDIKNCKKCQNSLDIVENDKFIHPLKDKTSIYKCLNCTDIYISCNGCSKLKFDTIFKNKKIIEPNNFEEEEDDIFEYNNCDCHDLFFCDKCFKSFEKFYSHETDELIIVCNLMTNYEKKKFIENNDLKCFENKEKIIINKNIINKSINENTKFISKTGIIIEEILDSAKNSYIVISGKTYPIKDKIKNSLIGVIFDNKRKIWFLNSVSVQKNSYTINKIKTLLF